MKFIIIVYFYLQIMSLSYLDFASVQSLNDNLKNSRRELFYLIVAKFNGKNFNVDDLDNLYMKINNNQLIDENNKIDNYISNDFQNKINSTNKIEIIDNSNLNDNPIKPINKDKCIARIYKNGEYCQCTRSKLNNKNSKYKNYCGLHINQLSKNGKLKFGDINSQCPEHPIHKSRGRPKKQIVENIDLFNEDE